MICESGKKLRQNDRYVLDRSIVIFLTFSAPGIRDKLIREVAKAQDKAAIAAKNYASQALRERYSLPENSSSQANTYTKPSIKESLSLTLLSNSGSNRIGNASQIKTSKRRLSAIRFLASELRPIRLSGVKVKNRGPIALKVGPKLTRSRKKFVQYGKDRDRLHVFRSRKKRQRLVMLRQSYPLIYSVLAVEKRKKSHGELSFG